jgi:hypothetical protein
VKSLIAMTGLALAAPMAVQAQDAVPSPTATAATEARASPLAAEIAGKLFPDGTYRRMLGPSFTNMMTGMVDGAANMPMGPILKAAGLDESAAAKLDKATIGEIMAIMDPAYKERMRRTMNGMFAAMIPLFEKMEPDLRDGLALSLQSRFSAQQLGELKTFFATPTGSAFAADQMLLFMDPAVMGKMQAQMPKIMEAMPALVAAAMESAKELPKAKSYKDLTTEERAKLAALLGVDSAKLKK